MKSNLLPNLLLGLLLFSALTAASLCLTYVQSMRTLQRLQAQAAAISQNRTIIQQLLLESIEYGKTNPEMAKILDQIGIKMKTATGEAPAKSVKK